MKKLYYNYVGLYAFAYAAMGVLSPLIGQYLAQCGFTGTQIGTITAAGTAAAIFSTIFWGHIYGNSKNKRGVIIFVLLSAMLISIILSLVKTYVLLLFFFGLLYFFQGTVMALIDAMTLEAQQPFGNSRKWGALGFAVSVYAAGRVAEISSLVVIFPLYSIAFLISVIIIFGIIKKERILSPRCDGMIPAMFDQPTALKRPSAVEASPEAQDGKLSYKEALANKKLIKLLVCCFFVYGTITAHNTYFGFLYTQVGGDVAGIGFAFLLMAGSEIPFMAWSEKLSAKFSLEKVVFAALCVSVLRHGWYSMAPSPGMILVFSFLQGIMNGILLVEFVRYISKLVPKAHIPMALAIYYAAGSGCSTILCQLIGGVILDNFGAADVYLFFSLSNLIAVVLYVIFGLHKPS